MTILFEYNYYELNNVPKRNPALIQSVKVATKSTHSHQYCSSSAAGMQTIRTYRAKRFSSKILSAYNIFFPWETCITEGYVKYGFIKLIYSSSKKLSSYLYLS